VNNSSSRFLLAIKRSLISVAVSGLFILPLFPVKAGDNQREREYASLLDQQPLLGRIVWLDASGQRFVSLYAEPEKGDNIQAAIILHDMGAFPDQKQVVQALRTQLPQHYWTTLALQMPLRESSASIEEYYPLFDEAEQRILVASGYLQKNGAKNIILIGYGLGAQTALYVVNKNPGAFAALITISLPVPEPAAPQVQSEGFIKNISLPFLDLYAEYDSPAVRNTATRRRLAAKGNQAFLQQQLEGENHTYQQDPDQLVKRIYGWLGTIFRKN
jgi:predicted esterase